MKLLYNWENPTSKSVSKRIEMRILETDVCTPMLTTALFTIVKILKQLKGPMTDKGVKKMWYIYIVECYWALKKKEILPFATAGMDWEGMKLSEIGQSQKNKHGTIPLTQVTSNSQT